MADGQDEARAGFVVALAEAGPFAVEDELDGQRRVRVIRCPGKQRGGGRKKGKE